MAEEKQKKTVLSLVQPSGDLTIGNYLGAIQNFVKLQDDYHCFFAVADEHAITVKQEAAKLRQRSLEVLATYIACGLDPSRCTLFIQSHLPQHAMLAWVLASLSYLGELERMPQFKVKSEQHQDNINAALFTYPVLMAADILLYQADYVPVGIDQTQHIEFARNLAIRFNNRYSPTFTVPEGLYPATSSKIMSLKDPTSKMSKSDPDPNAYILIRDEPETIRRKIARAVTDSEASFAYRSSQPGLMNLINIYCAYADKKPEEVVQSHQGWTYADFKKELADLIISHMEPIRQQFNELMSEKEQLKAIYTAGDKEAARVAQRTLSKVYRKVGFVKAEY